MPDSGPSPCDDLPLQVLLRPKSVVVEHLRGEGADVRMQPPRPLQEQAQRVGDGLAAHPAGAVALTPPRPADAIPGSAAPAAAGRPGARSTRRRPRWPGRSPARSGPPHPRTARRPSRRAPGWPTARRCRRRRRPRRSARAAARPARRRRGSPPRRSGRLPTRLLADAHRRPPPAAAALTTSSSRLPMTLWLLAVTPTLPAIAHQLARSSARRCTSCRNPADPGWPAPSGPGPGRGASRHRAASRPCPAVARRRAWPTRGGRRSSRSRAARHGPARIDAVLGDPAAELHERLLAGRPWGCTRAG